LCSPHFRWRVKQADAHLTFTDSTRSVVVYVTGHNIATIPFAAIKRRTEWLGRLGRGARSPGRTALANRPDL
jgi:hypothetical protein